MNAQNTIILQQTQSVSGLRRNICSRKITEKCRNEKNVVVWIHQDKGSAIFQTQRVNDYNEQIKIKQ